jgi:hypothetical protein
VTPGKDTWLIDSGASKHMTGQKNTLSKLIVKDSTQKVSLGDDYQYPIKGMGEATCKFDSGTPMRMKDVLYVPSLKKNLLSISFLDKKSFRVAFIDGEVLMWSKGKPIEDVVIGIEEGGLYKLKGHSDVALTHSTESPCELWHRRLVSCTKRGNVWKFPKRVRQETRPSKNGNAGGNAVYIYIYIYIFFFKKKTHYLARKT